VEDAADAADSPDESSEVVETGEVRSLDGVHSTDLPGRGTDRTWWDWRRLRDRYKPDSLSLNSKPQPLNLKPENLDS